jgi:hypothetical protein
MYDKIEDMARIFSIFHDGLVESWSLDGNDLKLAIDILYLAERIDPGYRTFYVTIFDVSHLEFKRWMNNQSPAPRLYDIHEIIQAQLEILEARIVGQGIEVNCNQSAPEFDYCGGSLFFRARGVKIFDQKMTAVLLEELDHVQETYWTEWKAKHTND